MQQSGRHLSGRFALFLLNMVFSSPIRAVSIVLGICCMLSQVLAAGYDISKPLKPLGPLGVTLDYSLATAWPLDQEPSTGQKRSRNWMWSSHLTFGQPVESITDAQLWQIVIDAYNEMTPDLAQYQLGKKNKPNVMTILAFGSEIILASSQKGLTSFSYNYKETEVLSSLQLCQIVWGQDGPFKNTDVQHKNRGSCGETMAAQLYYSVTDTPLHLHNPRIGSVSFFQGEPRPLAPCGDEDEEVGGRGLS